MSQKNDNLKNNVKYSKIWKNYACVQSMYYVDMSQLTNIMSKKKKKKQKKYENPIQKLYKKMIYLEIK